VGDIVPVRPEIVTPGLVTPGLTVPWSPWQRRYNGEFATRLSVIVFSSHGHGELWLMFLVVNSEVRTSMVLKTGYALPADEG
jgi:hypothetical protein